MSAAQGEVAAPDENLIAVLAQARRWLDQLAAGECGSAREISHRAGIDTSEVSRTIQLAFLAPDIVEAVLAGRQPVELTPTRLMRIGRTAPRMAPPAPPLRLPGLTNPAEERHHRPKELTAKSADGDDRAN